MNEEVRNWMIMKLDTTYHNAFEDYYNKLCGYYGRKITTSFEDIEILKLASYLTINR